jgi:carbamoyltransferase
MAGGVALNSLANARVQREVTEHLYVHAAAGDSGGAVGAALWEANAHAAKRISPALDRADLGSSYDDAEIVAVLKRNYGSSFETFESPEAAIGEIAACLSDGQVVGWFQGRSEWGPRSLGHRSILASPTTAEMQPRVNEKIKFREPFRPFAPSVLAEHASEFFDTVANWTPTSPENFMLSVVSVRQDARTRIPAVTHVDGTARFHTVRRETNPLFYALIEDFGRRTGVPVLLNTSFNLRGEPIVDQPQDAVNTFGWSGMDVLAIGRHLVRRIR